MEVLYFLVPFVLLGIGVIFIAFSGGPAAAREAYRSAGRGGRGFRILIVLIYLGAGIGVPAAVIAGRSEAEGGVGPLEQKQLSTQAEEGKQLFKQTCASCPDLDEIGEVSRTRVLSAIKNGGTGQKRMPANLLLDADAEAVATYVSQVA